uniref:Uncharacterized protein n=1 Tax=Arundo donax TaxID=35708 RepID=A0A0A9F4C7_ARUDO
MLKQAATLSADMHMVKGVPRQKCKAEKQMKCYSLGWGGDPLPYP